MGRKRTLQRLHWKDCEWSRSRTNLVLHPCVPIAADRAAACAVQRHPPAAAADCAPAESAAVECRGRRVGASCGPQLPQLETAAAALRCDGACAARLVQRRTAGAGKLLHGNLPPWRGVGALVGTPAAWASAAACCAAVQWGGARSCIASCSAAPPLRCHTPCREVAAAFVLGSGAPERLVGGAPPGSGGVEAVVDAKAHAPLGSWWLRATAPPESGAVAQRAEAGCLVGVK